MAISLVTISFIAVTAVALVVLGGVYVYRSYRSRQARNRDKNCAKNINKSKEQRKKDKIVTEESARQLNQPVNSEPVHEANESSEGFNRDAILAVDVPPGTRCQQLTNELVNPEEVKSPEESKLNQMKELINESMIESNQSVNTNSPVSNNSNFDKSGRRIPVLDGRHIRSYPVLGDENAEPVVEASIKQSNGTMSTGSFGNESSTSPTNLCHRLRANSDSNVVRRVSRIPRKIRDVEPDPRDAEGHKKPLVNGSNNWNGGPSPGVSPAGSIPSPISVTTKDTPTISPLTSSSSGVGRTMFNAKQVRD